MILKQNQVIFSSTDGSGFTTLEGAQAHEIERLLIIADFAAVPVTAVALGRLIVEKKEDFLKILNDEGQPAVSTFMEKPPVINPAL